MIRITSTRSELTLIHSASTQKSALLGIRTLQRKMDECVIGMEGAYDWERGTEENNAARNVLLFLSAQGLRLPGRFSAQLAAIASHYGTD